jgi:cytidine deaminase
MPKNHESSPIGTEKTQYLYDTGPEATRKPEAKDREIFESKLPELIKEATAARDSEAFSYRGFLIGASVLYEDPKNPAQYKIESGGNLKEDEKSPKLCAERHATQRAMADGAKRIIGIVIVSKETGRAKGTEQSEEPKSHVLHPCLSCRNMLHMEPVFSNQTMMEMVNDKNKDHLVEESATVGTFLKSYAQRDAETIKNGHISHKTLENGQA